MSKLSVASVSIRCTTTVADLSDMTTFSLSPSTEFPCGRGVGKFEAGMSKRDVEINALVKRIVFNRSLACSQATQRRVVGCLFAS